MRVIIAGPRYRSGQKSTPYNRPEDYENVKAAVRAFETKFNCKITEVVSGTAIGFDQLGEKYAIEYGIPLIRMPADWRPNGIFDRTAGFKRNGEMADCSRGLIAIWDQVSNGTRDMIQKAKDKGLSIHVHHIR